MTRQLRIASDLALPHEAVTQTFGVLGKRGVGKTHTASVIAEEMLKIDQHEMKRLIVEDGYDFCGHCFPDAVSA